MPSDRGGAGCGYGDLAVDSNLPDVIEAALNQDPAEGRRRMQALRRQVLTHEVDRWARSFLDALAGKEL